MASVAGIYLASPYYVAWRLEEAARAGQAARVAALSDLETVQANLPPELAAPLPDEAARVTAKRISLFARLRRLVFGLGRRPHPATALTAERLTALIGAGRAAPGSAAAQPHLASEAYVRGDLDTFEATVVSTGAQRPLVLSLSRRGFFNWRLTALGLAHPDAAAPARRS